jgi:SM-20-related protein
MSQGGSKWQQSHVRGDLHLWLHDRKGLANSSPAVNKLLDCMQEIQTELNAACAFDSHESQVQVACYPGGGARYVRHLDAFKGGASRRITAIYYINPAWTPAAGGCLRLFVPQGTEDHIDVEPLADRLLVFQSRLVEHAVLPSHDRRFAITIWFY